MVDQSDNNRDELGRFVPGNTASAESGWQPGRSGNPAGRPPNEWSITHHLKQVLSEPNGKRESKARKLARKWYEAAADGNVRAIEGIAERVDGKPRQAVDLEYSEKVLVPD